MNYEAPSEKIELQIAPGFEEEMEAVIGVFIRLYIEQRFAVVLTLMELRKEPGRVDRHAGIGSRRSRN